MGRRGPVLLAVLAVVAAVLGLVPLPHARASCVGPAIAVGNSVDDARRPTSGVLPAAGSEVTVSGVWFSTGCDDTGGGAGCAGPRGGAPSPVGDVPLVLEQGASSWLLGTADAGSPEDHYATRWRVVVPDGPQPGAATLRAGTATDLAVTITP